MKLVFLVIAIFINFFNHSLIKSEEKIDSNSNERENIAKIESNNENKTEIRKIHIVKNGDTISNISKFYSINKNSIIKLNNLNDENYIFIGQNLIISESTENSPTQTGLINNFHVVQIGENLTDISNTYNLDLGYLIEINQIKNPDSIKVGEKLLLNKNNKISSENYQIIKLDKKIYGPIIIQSKSHKKVKERIILNVLNKEDKELILAISCDTNELDVRIPGRKWMGGEPAKEEFEKNLINDFCYNF